MEGSRAIANRLKQVCEKKNMSFSELAKKSGVPVKTILRMSYGTNASRGIYNMINICDGLGITLDEFFGTDEFKEFRK